MQFPIVKIHFKVTIERLELELWNEASCQEPSLLDL